MNTGEREPKLIVGIGEVLWDMLPAGGQPGGAPANCVLHARAIGAAASLISCVGRDSPGDEIVSCLAGHGVCTAAVAVDPVHPTGRVSVQVTDAGEPRFTIEEDVAWDFIPATREATAIAAAADAICYGTLAQRSPMSRATVRTCIEAAREGCVRVFDVNLRDPFVDFARLADTLTRSDVLKLNELELRRVAQSFGWTGGETAILDNLLARHPLRVIALTKGARGSRLYGRDGNSVHPGYAVDVVDTVGAGDAFTAALIVGLLEGRPLDAINDAANRVASLVCTRSGACPPLALPPA